MAKAKELKTKGTFLHFCGVRKAYIYALNNTLYAWNGKGVQKVNV